MMRIRSRTSIHELSSEFVKNLKLFGPFPNPSGTRNKIHTVYEQLINFDICL